jgi:3-methyladenine DNA glycosylase AlkD
MRVTGQQPEQLTAGVSARARNGDSRSHAHNYAGHRNFIHSATLSEVDRALIATVRADLRAAADPVRAPQMQAYMKSAMPYLGVPVPDVRRIVRAAARVRPPVTTDVLAGTAAGLWREAAYREERYAATALLGVPGVRRLQTLELVPLYREMITTGAWWDHVDEVAHRIGDLLRSYPAELRPTLSAWARDPDRWLRRASVICQVGLRTSTDTEVLSDAIVANLGDRDFFLRKAIGWALRDYARTEPDWVRAFVAAHDLSPLSRREALKHLEPE